MGAELFKWLSSPSPVNASFNPQLTFSPLQIKFNQSHEYWGMRKIMMRLKPLQWFE